MKNLLTVISLTALLCACQVSQQAGSYIVEGEVQDSSTNGKMIYIMRYDDEVLVDSTRIKDNKFRFSGKVDTAAFCRIDVTHEEFGNFILENGKIQVNLKKYNQPSGSPQNIEMAKLDIEEDSIYTAINQKREELQQQYTDPSEFRTQWKMYYNNQREGWKSRLMELYKTHNNDAIGFYIIYTIFMKRVEPDAQEAAIATFGPWLKSTRMAQELIARIEGEKKTAEGKLFTDIKGKDKDGHAVALSDYVGKGKYVLMDMWSSWCGPCREEIPNLATIYNKYKDKGLTVVGLFVWDEEENLQEALDEEKITWPQIIDTKETAMESYGTAGIPFIVLFAPDGTILKRDLRGEPMMQTIDEIMSKK